MFALGAVCVFSQNELTQRGSIPEELLRPRREEAPRYPIDTVIGELGQGQVPQGAYDVARKTAAALLAGNMDAPILASVSKGFLESCMTMLAPVNPRSFRLGSGREEPDGSVSFLVRFIGREQGITGELYIRLEVPRLQPRPADPEPQPAISETNPEAEDDPAGPESENKDISAEQVAQIAEPAAPAGRREPEPEPEYIPGQKAWLFEDLILEEPRSREEENSETRHRFDFPPYERFF